MARQVSWSSRATCPAWRTGWRSFWRRPTPPWAGRRRVATWSSTSSRWHRAQRTSRCSSGANGSSRSRLSLRSRPSRGCLLMRSAPDSVQVTRGSFMRPPLVLAYHALGEVRREHDPEGLVISPLELRKQVERLQEREYEFVTMTEFGHRLVESRPLHGVCALTFDDGSLDNGTLLPSLLRA